MIVIIMADDYLPGSKASGPIRSLANLVEALGDEFAFRVCLLKNLDRARDLGLQG